VEAGCPSSQLAWGGLVVAFVGDTVSVRPHLPPAFPSAAHDGPRSGEVDVEIWDAVRGEMLDLAERLADLEDEQWNSPSLCDQWRIRDVLAHVTAGAEGAFGVGWIFRSMFRHGFNYNRWVAADGQVRGQQDPAVILKALRNAAANRKAPSRPVKSLMHVLIHGQDICRPLGIKRDLPDAHLLPVADFVKDDVHIFGAKKRIAGLELTATDMDWSHGSGPEVTGPAEALVMMMAGRLVALDDLSGAGKAALAARLSASEPH
jgi:uncharacterized protein (TIGR03083 family)